MKYIFTLLLGGLLTTSAFASNITLNFAGSRNYQVMIDGRTISDNDYAANNVIYLNNISTGQHSIEVYRLKRKGLFGSGSRMVYSSYFSVSPQYDVNLTVNDNGSVTIYQNRSRDYGRNGNWGTDHRGKAKHNRDGDDDDRDQGYGHGDNGYGNNGHGNGGWNNSSTRVMSDYEFNQLMQDLRSQWSSGRINTARDAFSRGYFNVSQVRQVLQSFSHENERLDLAKQAYKNTVDMQNFRQLYDLFSYGAQNELDQYIRNFRY